MSKSSIMGSAHEFEELMRAAFAFGSSETVDQVLDRHKQAEKLRESKAAAERRTNAPRPTVNPNARGPSRASGPVGAPVPKAELEALAAIRAMGVQDRSAATAPASE